MRLDQVEQEIADALALLSATAYVQVTGDAWAESEVPMTPLWEPDTTRHLAYSVVVTSSTSTDERRNRVGGVARVASIVSVYWSYCIRPGSQVADTRLQLRSAGDIVALVNNEVANWSDETEGDAVAMLLTAYEIVAAAGSDDTPYQIARVVFRVDHNLSL